MFCILLWVCSSQVRFVLGEMFIGVLFVSGLFSDGNVDSMVFGRLCSDMVMVFCSGFFVYVVVIVYFIIFFSLLMLL